MARCATRAGRRRGMAPALGIAAVALWIVAVWIALAAWPGRTAAEPEASPATLVVKTDSLDSIRDVFRELGYEFDEAAARDRFEELQNECFLQGSRRFGNIPRPIRFLGLAYSRGDATHRLITVCHALRPYDDTMARELCESLDRPLVENRIFDMLLICGKKGTLPKPPTDAAGRRLGDWP